MADGSSTSPNKETVTLRLPSGEMVDAIVPAGFADADLKSYVRMKRPDLFGAPAGVQKPQADMQAGAAPIATSFATQLSNLPRNLWEGSFFGEIGNPRVKAEHEQRIKAMEAPGMEGVKNTFQAANPIVSNESGVDIGASAANLLPYLLSAKGLRTPDMSTSDALAAAKAIGKVAAKDAAAHIPVAGRLVQRPSIMDYIRAAQTKAAPQAPAVYPGAPNPTATPEQLNPALTSQSRTLPGMNPPEVIRPPAQRIPPRSGLMLPGDTEKLIPPSKVSTTPPTKSSQLAQAKGAIPAVKDMSMVLPRLREIAQQIQTKEASAAANDDLTPALEKSLQPRIQGKIMQVVRREGTLGMDRLMQAPELQGISKEQVEKAATSLGNSKKLWVPMKEADAHGPAGIISLALRKR